MMLSQSETSCDATASSLMIHGDRVRLLLLLVVVVVVVVLSRG